ncbi:substrate-binding domain-containing protein [Candidatus Agathobaculum pullicola]|uniref:substrate-binding domain-containing protein n=1 Tax=Candidatus Agathobaculum pullicola TaxID=2838426 RepID=UPI003F912E08
MKRHTGNIHEGRLKICQGCKIFIHYQKYQAILQEDIKHGHRRIGLLAGRFSWQIYTARDNSCISVLKKHGLTEDLRFMQDIKPTAEAAEQYIASILHLGNRPTAVFYTNDTIVIDAIKVVTRARLRAPLTPEPRVPRSAV